MDCNNIAFWELIVYLGLVLMTGGVGGAILYRYHMHWDVNKCYDDGYTTGFDRGYNQGYSDGWTANIAQSID